MSRFVAARTVVIAAILAGCNSSAAPSQPAAATGAPTATAGIVTAGPSLTATAAPTAVALQELKLLWQKGGPPHDLGGTYWPAINPVTGQLWVANSFQNQYLIFKPDGTAAGTWGTGGSGDGQLNLTTHDVHPDPVGAIAFAPDGTFYVADAGNYRIQKFDKNGKFLTKWGSFGDGDGQFGQPKGIATDGKLVYVADDPRVDMQVFDAEGKFLRKFPYPTIGVDLAPDGSLWSGGGQVALADVVHWDATGKELARFTMDPADVQGGGVSVLLDRASNHLIVLIGGRHDDANTNRAEVLELDLQGHVLARWSGADGTPALSPDGKTLYVAVTFLQDPNWQYIRTYALP
jgi:DNA-binding beta-propeller fold protein YncE